MRKLLYTVIFLVILVFVFLRWGTGLYVDLLWFDSVGYSSVFYKILFSELGFCALIGIVIFAVLFINLFITKRPLIKSLDNYSMQQDGIIEPEWEKYVTPKVLTLVYILVSLLLAVFVGTVVKGDWIVLQQYLNATAFNISEPVFQKDIGFYVFKLPFYQLIYQLLIGVTIISALAAVAVYFLIDLLRGGFDKLFKSVTARYHLSAIAAVFFVIKAWGYKLDQYQLLFSEGGAVYGAGYTDIHARLLALKILFVISLIIAVVVLVNIFMRRFRFVLYSVGALIIVSIVVGSIYPAAIQKFIVSPNELVKESPYIENNIKYTRMAYNLDKIENREFPAGKTLNREDINQNEEIINNIRLWDPRPLKDTYSQLQEMRLYYQFNNIDIDRYMVDGEYRQVMLAAREMNQGKLSERAKTWINQRLKYTHGFGVAVSPVNEVRDEGLPEFFLKDIPPVGNTGLQVDRPQIYYGESTDDFVVVDTGAMEFDYPRGEGNAYTEYEGDGGIKVNSVFRRGILAFVLRDYRFFVASDIENKSQVLMRRNIKERVPHIAPFLKYDGDPYIVVSEGKLYWMWDAYTTTNMFPYSEPFGGRENYIRNSVKVVVDAYSGNVDFYSAEPDEPILQTYGKIFPDLFKPLDEMPEDLRSHVRYPVDMYKVQADKYSVYHMQDVEMFYNKEDQWNLPTEQYGRNETTMEPYYTLTKISGEQDTEFTLIMPFTPKNKKNMIAWLAARSDGENYGKLLVYRFPKQELVYGPMQVESRINQDGEISKQISLWDQRSSSVIRGNLIVMPIKDSLLYVEPLYLQSSDGKLPELRRVIVAHGDQIVMEPSLDIALQKIFGADTSEDSKETGENKEAGAKEETGVEKMEKELVELIEEANQLYTEALDKQKEGDWQGYGEKIQEFKEVLDKLDNKK
ncbi:MAG: UPF0182 family protein [Clostridiales bacterium]|nr:UPF0182 family protein [Clostridiales bacterium]MCF8022954.1 UPF0182 family protein [Clostridiales bacterium]